MKVRMLDSVAGLPMPEYGMTDVFSYGYGNVVDLDPRIAEKWIASGKAEEVVQEEKKRGKKTAESEKQAEPETEGE